MAAMMNDEVPSESIYAIKKLLESGVDFGKVKKSDLLMACGEYNGIISDENYGYVLTAIERIYVTN